MLTFPTSASCVLPYDTVPAHSLAIYYDAVNHLQQLTNQRLPFHSGGTILLSNVPTYAKDYGRALSCDNSNCLPNVRNWKRQVK